MSAPETPEGKLIAVCPHCGQKNRVVPGNVRCGRCGQRFHVVVAGEPGATSTVPRPPPSEVRDRLVEMLKDEDRYVRIHAMMSLGDHLDPSLIALMEGLLRDPDSQIRAMAVQYYAKLNRLGG